MKDFCVKTVTVLSVIVILCIYNNFIGSSDTTLVNSSGNIEVKYKDGIYEGEADGFGGKINVEVNIEKGKIKEINVISAEKEDKAYLTMAKDIINRIIDSQSYDVDTISGATFSSTGIKNATEEALKKAKD